MKVLFSRYLGNIEQSWRSVNGALPNLVKGLPEPEAGQEDKGSRDVLQFVLEMNKMRVITHLIYTLAKVVFIVALAAWECSAAGPTLARLSFWVSPERMSEFEATYKETVVPVLKRHSLVESSVRGRTTPDHVFSRLFEVSTTAQVEEKNQSLQQDPTWTALLEDLGEMFKAAGSDGRMRYRLAIYAAPATSGKTVSAEPVQVIPAGPGTSPWRTFDTTDGLAGDAVTSIFQDREGNLWFGTWGSGVSRYDGETWTTFTTKDGLGHNRVDAIVQDGNGSLWFGTNDGLNRYDRETWTTFTTKDGLVENKVYAIFQDREGVLWAGTGGGVSRYDGETWIPFSMKDKWGVERVYAILQDGEGHLWFGTLGGGVIRYDGEIWTPFTTKDGLSGNTVTSIVEDRKGNLWFGTPQGVSRYDGQIFTSFTAKDGLARIRFGEILQDREGNLWVGTVEGVSRYDGEIWITFTQEDGLARGEVSSIFQDREGHLWFGTNGGGVSQLDQAFTTFTSKDGLVGAFSIFQDREDNLWVGTWQSGVSRYDGQAFTTFAIQGKEVSNGVVSMVQDREGHIWFGTKYKGITRYDPSASLSRAESRGSGQATFTTFTTKDGLARNNVTSIFEDRKGYLWIGTGRIQPSFIDASGDSTDGGISRYDGETFVTFDIADGLPDNRVNCITEDRQGHLWIGTWGGVSRYDGQTFTNFTTKDGLADNEVGDIVEDRQGHLWIGTRNGGVSRYDGQTFTNFTTKDGLASNVVYSIAEDRQGHLWIATRNGGVSRYDGQTFQTMTRQDGLSNNVLIAFQDRAGHFWFIRSYRLTRFRPPVPVPPPVLINAVVADHRYEDISELEISSTIELVAFEFSGANFKTRPGAMVYRYRLKGYEEDWQNTRKHRVEYEDLSRGIYTFEVVSVDRDLVYSETPATVALTVHLPYDRIGLLSALGIAIVLIAWQSVRVIRRDRRLHAANTALSSANRDLFGLNSELQKKTSDLKDANVRLKEVDVLKTDFFSNVSHELRTPMTAIKGYIDNMLDGIAGTLNEKQDRYLTRVKSNADRLTRLINDLLDLSRIERGRTDLLQLHIETLSVRGVIQEAVEGLRPMAESAGLTLRFEGDEVSVRADRDRLVQVVTDLVGNAVKFTPAGGEISVTVKSDGSGYVQTAVRDTGKGIAAEDLDQVFDRFYQVKDEGGGLSGGTGLGLPITKELVELQDGQIWVESEVGVGSIFTFTLPGEHA